MSCNIPGRKPCLMKQALFFMVWWQIFFFLFLFTLLCTGCPSWLTPKILWSYDNEYVFSLNAATKFWKQSYDLKEIKFLTYVSISLILPCLRSLTIVTNLLQLLWWDFVCDILRMPVTDTSWHAPSSLVAVCGAASGRSCVSWILSSLSALSHHPKSLCFSAIICSQGFLLAFPGG